MGYANSHNIPYVAIIGEAEMENNLIALKDMNSGEQKQVTSEELIKLLS